MAQAVADESNITLLKDDTGSLNTPESGCMVQAVADESNITLLEEDTGNLNTPQSSHIYIENEHHANKKGRVSKSCDINYVNLYLQTNNALIKEYKRERRKSYRGGRSKKNCESNYHSEELLTNNSLLVHDTGNLNTPETSHMAQAVADESNITLLKDGTGNLKTPDSSLTYNMSKLDKNKRKNLVINDSRSDVSEQLHTINALLKMYNKRGGSTKNCERIYVSKQLLTNNNLLQDDTGNLKTPKSGHTVKAVVQKSNFTVLKDDSGNLIFSESDNMANVEIRQSNNTFKKGNNNFKFPDLNNKVIIDQSNNNSDDRLFLKEDNANLTFSELSNQGVSKLCTNVDNTRSADKLTSEMLLLQKETIPSCTQPNTDQISTEPLEQQSACVPSAQFTKENINNNFIKLLRDKLPKLEAEGAFKMPTNIVEIDGKSEDFTSCGYELNNVIYKVNTSLKKNEIKTKKIYKQPHLQECSDKKCNSESGKKEVGYIPEQECQEHDTMLNKLTLVNKLPVNGRRSKNLRRPLKKSLMEDDLSYIEKELSSDNRGKKRKNCEENNVSQEVPTKHDKNKLCNSLSKLIPNVDLIQNSSKVMCEQSHLTQTWSPTTAVEVITLDMDSPNQHTKSPNSTNCVSIKIHKSVTNSKASKPCSRNKYVVNKPISVSQLNSKSSLSTSTGTSGHAAHSTLDSTCQPAQKKPDSEPVFKELSLEECLDGAPPFIQEVFNCDNIKDGFVNADLIFVLSLVPDIEEMTDAQRLYFQSKTIEILDDVLSNPQLQTDFNEIQIS